MKCVDAEYISSEKELFNLKIEHRNSCVVFKNTESKVIPMKKHLSQIESDNIHLETTKQKIVEEIEKLEKSNSSIKKQINDHRNNSFKSSSKTVELSVQEKEIHSEVLCK